MTALHGQERIKDYLIHQFNLPGEQVDTLIPDFLETLADHLANLDRAQRQGSLEELGKAAHTIKGALLNLGLHESAALALEIEQAAKAADGSADYFSLLGRLHATLSDYLL